MRDYPNTEATISEIMGAISLRVLWAVVKRVLGWILFYIIILGIGISAESYFQWGHELKPEWGVPLFTLWLWAYLSEATGNRSFHRARWYFPKTNGFTSLLMSAYVVFSAWALLSVEKGVFGGLLFFVLYGFPLSIYYILNCGYYLVMLRRYPRYRHEDFAIPMPSALLKLSKKKGGITGAGNGDGWDDADELEDD